jgi:hypothetical protein
MIRRDYILRMLAEFFEVLSRIRALKKGQKWEEASLAGDQEFQRLISGGAQLALKLSETELLARLINGEPTLAVRDKTLMLTSLLKEEGDIAAGQGRHLDSKACYLKGLHLLLGVLVNENIDELPEFVPRIDAFLIALANSPLPMGTYAMLMRHYELAGEFGKAEDALFSMVEEEPDNLGLLDFGIGFYQRLQAKSDDALLTGNLPRVELKASLEQLLARKKTELARTSTGVQ